MNIVSQIFKITAFLLALSIEKSLRVKGIMLIIFLENKLIDFSSADSADYIIVEKNMRSSHETTFDKNYYPTFIERSTNDTVIINTCNGNDRTYEEIYKHSDRPSLASESKFFFN